eukprot:COSAG02_NODE_21_length_53083_cov_95.733618_7_plen_683_part_00
MRTASAAWSESLRRDLSPNRSVRQHLNFTDDAPRFEQLVPTLELDVPSLRWTLGPPDAGGRNPFAYISFRDATVTSIMRMACGSLRGAFRDEDDLDRITYSEFDALTRTFGEHELRDSGLRAEFDRLCVTSGGRLTFDLFYSWWRERLARKVAAGLVPLIAEGVPPQRERAPLQRLKPGHAELKRREATAKLELMRLADQQAYAQAQLEDASYARIVAEEVPAQVRAPPPPSVQRAGDVPVDPFAADREFFRSGAPTRASDRAMGAMGAMGAVGAVDAIDAIGVDILDQGQSGTCVRYALAAAIRDNVNARFGSHHHYRRVRQVSADHLPELDIDSQKGIVHSLMERSVDADGCFPNAYDGSQIKVKDTQGRWYRVDISITQNTSMNDRALVGEDTRDRSHEDFANVIGYDCAQVHEGKYHGRHCIYLGDCDLAAQEWIGLNSWGDVVDPSTGVDTRYPRISMHHSVAIYNVCARSCVLLKGSYIDKPLDGETEELTVNMVLWGEDRVQDDTTGQESRFLAAELETDLEAEKLARQRAERELAKEREKRQHAEQALEQERIARLAAEARAREEQGHHQQYQQEEQQAEQQRREAQQRREEEQRREAQQRQEEEEQRQRKQQQDEQAAEIRSKAQRLRDLIVERKQRATRHQARSDKALVRFCPLALSSPTTPANLLDSVQHL